MRNWKGGGNAAGVTPGGANGQGAASSISLNLHVDNMVVREEEDLPRLANLLANLIGTQVVIRGANT